TMLWDTMISPLKQLYHTIKSVWSSISGDSKTAAKETALAAEAAMKPLQDQKDFIKWGMYKNIENAARDRLAEVQKGEKGDEGAKGGKGNEIHAELKPKSEAVHGQSQVTINVVVQKMIGIEKFVATTVKGAEMSADHIVKLLTGAINQFQAEIST
ncbi:MAG TPA: hypothetical protein VN026_18150, partial [Bacteroidia bacterium]|nr:hypothetical protein [Bacteroidia bacterium]